MTPWEWVLVVYLVMGVAISSCAKIGHRARFGYKMHWLHWWVGLVIWPLVLLLGGRKK